MSLLSPLFEKRASVSQSNPRDPVVAEWFGGGGNTAAGITVNPDKAMRVIAVYSAVRIIAETVASLPLPLYKIRADGGKDKAPNHPLYTVLHDQPNNWQTAFEFREMITGHACLRGNGYAEIISGMSFASQLIPLHPDRVLPFQAPDGSIAYEYSPVDGPKRIILQNEMLHIRGLSQDGIVGVSPIQLAAEGLGLALATEEFGARFFGNGTTPGGVLEHPEKLSDLAYERLRKTWAERHHGADNAHKPAILEEGMKWQTMGVPPEEAQFLETRKFQITEIARLFRVPPHMLGDLERATFSNIEQQGIDFVVHTLRPWLVRWEQAIQRDLLSGRDRKRYFAKHNVDGLLRGDSEARQSFYTGMFGIGAYSVNDIREKEDDNPVEGGDKRFIPLNMTTLEKAGTEPEQPAEPAQDENNERMNALITESVRRMAHKETEAVRKLIKRQPDIDDFVSSVYGFYRKHVDTLAKALGISERSAKRYTFNAANSLIAAYHDKDAVLLDLWESERHERLYEIGSDGDNC